MVTKLQAADLARHGGTDVVIANGACEDVIVRLAHGEKLGTHLLPTADRLESRKRRILSGSRTRAEIVIDAGAVRALARGGSLLPAGMVRLSGLFERGDAVRVVSMENTAIAIGLTNYSAADLLKLSGHQSAEIESILGYTFGEEVIHRDHMVLL
jgi:glutamate 5-kinase